MLQVRLMLTYLSHRYQLPLHPLSLPHPLAYQIFLAHPYLVPFQDMALVALKTSIALKPSYWSDGMPRSRLSQFTSFPHESWSHVHLWRSRASWTSTLPTFDVTTQTDFARNLGSHQSSLTASWNSSKTMGYFTTTPMSHSILSLSNLPSFSFVLGTMAMHHHPNMLLSGLGYALGWWSTQHTAV